MTVKLIEAPVSIDGVPLNTRQSMALRVAVSSMRIQLQEAEHREALGPSLAAAYDLNLREVERMLIDAINRRSGPSAVDPDLAGGMSPR